MIVLIAKREKLMPITKRHRGAKAIARIYPERGAVCETCGKRPDRRPMAAIGTAKGAGVVMCGGCLVLCVEALEGSTTVVTIPTLRNAHLLMGADSTLEALTVLFTATGEATTWKTPAAAAADVEAARELARAAIAYVAAGALEGAR